MYSSKLHTYVATLVKATAPRRRMHAAAHALLQCNLNGDARHEACVGTQEPYGLNVAH